ncbi:Uncharacterized protein APZ42_025897 [Daphnia magna]|uniref:Uncharacterized protein n=1 Tax=Daphnia magna TaxID=35525 RepID=A0A164SNL1_9CRUS|nr:Uncharacterized protein APZ42_025897 [Daphnia magna]
MPRNLYCLLSLMRSLLMSMFSSRSFFVFLVKVKAAHLVVESSSFQCLVQLSIMSRDVLQSATGGGKSAIVILKSIGLKTHPWGTPLLRYLSSDMLFSILTVILLLVRKFWSQLSLFQIQEYCCGGFLFIEAADDIGFETNYVIVGSAPTSKACLEFWKRHEVSEIGLSELVSSGGLFGFRIGMTKPVFGS